MTSPPRSAARLPWVALPLALLALLAACDGSGNNPTDGGEVCEPGLAGCPCAAGNVCATEADGATLMCEDGYCVSQRCARGETGCACVGGTRCTSSNDECNGGICKPADCRAGELNCDCLAGTCGAGLYCHTSLGGGTCVSDVGYPGGPCLSNRLCHEQSRCDGNTLTCVYCEQGSQGCIPLNGGCNPGLLLFANRCLSPSDVPPSNPVCHTPCLADYAVDDEFRECPPNGIMDGCVGLAECQNGSCVLPDGVVPTCQDDVDCPSFQTCMQDGAQRRCYSNCDPTHPCGMGYSCHEFVCRVPCVVAQTQAQLCPSGYVCASSDGTTGHCMPSADPEPPPVLGPHATVDLSRDHVLLAGAETVVNVGITTDSPTNEAFDIVRVSHRAYNFAGDVVLDTATSANTMIAPLAFVKIGVGTDSNASRITVPRGCAARSDCPVLRFSLDPTRLNSSWARWEGVVELRHPRLGVSQITVAQLLGADGTWVGEATYFASFPGAVSLNALRDAVGRPAKLAAALQVQNALVGAGWAGYRSGGMEGASRELRAMLSTAADGSWQWPSVRDACAAHNSSAEVCYLYDDGQGSSGARTWFTRSQGFQMPTGATQLPVSLHLRSADVPGGGYEIEGVIDSSTALHYGGFPTVRMSFEADPMADGRCLVDAADGIPTDCVTFMTSFESDVWAGARSELPTGTCPDETAPTDVPWLLGDFLGGTTSTASGGRSRRHCRDTSVPFVGDAAANASWAQANPIPDGRRILRQVRMIDGAIINQGTMFMIFEERFHTGFRDGGFVTYGYMLLERTENAPTPEDFTTATVSNAANTGAARVSATCSQPLLRELGWSGGAISSSSNPTALASLAGQILYGVQRPLSDNRYNPEDIHYLCVDTGTFDGGPNVAPPQNSYPCPSGTSTDISLWIAAGLCGSAAPPADASFRAPCPEESRVVYFARTGSAAISAAAMAAEPCQTPGPSGIGTCAARLDEWARSTTNANFQLNPTWQCLSGSHAYCSDYRYDLRRDKVFFRPGVNDDAPLGARIEGAFLYRTRFTSDTGRQLGFAPLPCGAGAGQTPYCYDPQAIEEVAERVDCLMAVYEAGVTTNNRDQALWAELRGFLEASFVGFGASGTFGAQPGQFGFERLYAELQVLLGDEAQTQALRSRFDLAGTNGAIFQGSRFESGGMDVTGLAGYELHSLYQATQYYQLALDRFYRVSAPLIHSAMARGDLGDGGALRVVGPELPTEFLERLIGASTKLTRTWSEIARRYQGFNRPDLARRVLERAYTAAHIESVVLSQLMIEITDATGSQYRDQLLQEIETAKRRYRVALAEMRDIYSSLSDDVSFFGFAPDYVPFPAVDVGDGRISNAFEAVVFTARRRLETARRFEDEAIQSDRSFEADAAGFQSELVRIQVNHEQRLHQVCGSFTGTDGQVHPATSRYRHLSPRTSAVQDPCGMVENGELCMQGIAITSLVNERAALHQRMEHLVQREGDEKERVVAQCEHIASTADARQERQRQIRGLNIGIGTLRTAVSAMDRAMGHIGVISQTTAAGADTPWGLAITSTLSLSYGALAAIHTVAAGVAEATVVGLESAIADIEIEGLDAEAIAECRTLVIESIPNLKQIRRDADMLSYEARDLTHRFARATGEVERLLLEARRLNEEQSEAEQLAINVEAARNDPNIRVYRNAAVINADRSFYRALQYAYRATLVLEYYTSQSYAQREQLFLTRMVGHGYYNLENYMDELEDAYEYFREQYRTRALRVEVISLRDDVFRIPRNGATAPNTTGARAASFHEQLTDRRYLDANGHISIPFRTKVEDVSACTFSHQIEFVEVWFQGAAPDDFLAEAMIWQEGTGVIANLAGSYDYYQLPPALMVAHPFFSNNGRHFDPSVYRRYELRERPYVNTAWRFVFDAYGNEENADIDPSSLNDILIYVYYTDFTDPERCR